MLRGRHSVRVDSVKDLSDCEGRYCRWKSRGGARGEGGSE